jgi:hypothetical protein
MPKVSKRKALQENSEGEDFGNDDFSDDPSDGFISEPEEDPWEPIVAVDGTRGAFEQVNDSLLNLNESFYSEVYIIGTEVG